MKNSNIFNEPENSMPNKFSSEINYDSRHNSRAVGSTDAVADAVLEVTELKKEYTVSAGYVFSRNVGTITAVGGISFQVGAGETFGLVGESGCGKTTAGRMIAGLLPADGGKVEFMGVDLIQNPPKFSSPLRRAIQVIFQDPLSSLNPRMTVGDIVAEPLVVHKMVSNKELRASAAAALNEVNLNESFLDRYPHQLSGGQRQRVLFARALILSPGLVVADEPVSALDVSVQAQILNLFKELQARKKFASLFISHDLAVVRYICRRVGVMYLGRLVETGPAGDLFTTPLHPYTKALKESSPDIRTRSIGAVLSGTIPNPLTPPTGCPFNPRCSKSEEVCKTEKPLLEEKSPGRWAACHLV